MILPGSLVALNDTINASYDVDDPCLFLKHRPFKRNEMPAMIITIADMRHTDWLRGTGHLSLLLLTTTGKLRWTSHQWVEEVK